MTAWPAFDAAALLTWRAITSDCLPTFCKTTTLPAPVMREPALHSGTFQTVKLFAKSTTTKNTAGTMKIDATTSSRPGFGALSNNACRCSGSFANVVAAFPQAKGQQGDLKETGRARPSSGRFGDMAAPHAHPARIETDTSAARFFYVAKVSGRERNEGLPDGMTNIHPTLKPVSLMAYLCRLVTPPGGVVFDPFMGSGSTGKAALREGFSFIGCEMDAAYFAIAQARIAAVKVAA